MTSEQITLNQSELNRLLDARLLHGLLIASFICETRAGERASENAMAIMKYRTTAEMALSQGKPIPDWITPCLR